MSSGIWKQILHLRVVGFEASFLATLELTRLYSSPSPLFVLFILFVQPLDASTMLSDNDGTCVSYFLNTAFFFV